MMGAYGCAAPGGPVPTPLTRHMEQQGKPHCRVRARQLARTRRSLLCLSRAHRVATSGTEEDMQLRTFTNNARPPGISRLLLVNQTGTQEPSGADWTQAPFLLTHPVSPVN
ncbi:hypothetical protein ACFSC4_24335 [Deinococcus malanensis]|uniref:hypothetical protein n=1 Tax=Deinococcus malanensis TaxID=1706855 RepID=UPI0036454CB1